MSAHDGKVEAFDGKWFQFPPLRNALLAGVVAFGTFVGESWLGLPRAISIGLYAATILLGGLHWIREGLEDLVHERVIGIEMLMIGATTGAALLGLWNEAAALVVLYGAAEGLEEFTYARTRASIRGLLDLAPKEARVIENGEEKTVPATALTVGARFRVRPGEGIATDGVVVEGRSGVNEAAVTGESMPVDKATGSKAFAGSINGEGVLTIEATAAFADNTLSKVIHLVEQAQDEKGRAQQWIERFGRRYSPAVLAAAILLIVVPWALDGDVVAWAKRATVLLVAAAPCALIMSMPMAMAAGIGAAGKRGILIKGGAHLEHLGVIRTIAFDKTGTLTLGRPVVTDVVPVGFDADELLAIAATVENFSQHPLAQAIVAAAAEKMIALRTATEFKSITGGGARADVDGQGWLIGSPALAREMNIPFGDLLDAIDGFQAEGKTAVVIATGGKAMGVIAMQDQLRPEAREVVAALHAQGIRTVMLTGDNQVTGEAVARRIGIDHVRAGLKPDGKVAAIRELGAGGPVLMVGDGVNDAPALAAATCGIAMGAAGTDAAIDAADVALMADDLKQVPVALALGLKARRVSRQNIVLSLAVLAVMIPLAVAGVIGIALTVAVHETAELIAVANGLRAGKP
ncbi:MAG TPA: heavy metal translocating P-type ATPase [Steroidobacteraceae bacterium]|nr:heavy metal translocating P-type ATPase [Steroidobacteraceae bacterium]